MKRKPLLRMTGEQLLKHCLDCKRCPLFAGQVLALYSMMDACGWKVPDLIRRSKLPRSTVEAMLVLRRFSSVDTLDALAKAFGWELYELDRLAVVELSAVMLRS
jgi:hypothetical protein